MGIDIRNSGSDDNAGTVDGNSPWYVPGGGTWQGTISNGSGQGTASGQTSGGATPVQPVISSPQWTHLIQSVQNALMSNGNAPSVGFSCDPKLNDMFAVDFTGFSFGTVNANGTPNIDILEDAVVAVGTMKRGRHGWESFDMALIDDQESDVVNIMHKMLDENQRNGTLFDMTVRFYDKLGNEKSVMYICDCEIVNIQTDPLNQATQNPNTPQKLVVEIFPKLVRYV